MRPLFLVMVGLVSCTLSGSRANSKPPPPRPPTRIEFHVDLEFTHHERHLLQLAADDIESQTGGHVQVAFKYDLDYKTEIGRPSLDEWYLTRLDSLSVENRFQTGDLFFGLTVPRLKQTMLVWDRLGADNQFRHTAMHEIFHALGVPHLPCPNEDDESLGPKWCKEFAPGRIMPGRATWEDGQDAPLCMNAADADGVARVTHQPRADFRPCL